MTLANTDVRPNTGMTAAKRHEAPRTIFLPFARAIGEDRPMHWALHGKAAIYKDRTSGESTDGEGSSRDPAVPPPVPPARRWRRGPSALRRAASRAIAALARLAPGSGKGDR